jgi:hypothetical protein
MTEAEIRAAAEAKAAADAAQAAAIQTAAAAAAQAALAADAERRAGIQSRFAPFASFPGYEFKTIDGLLTNFHMPESTVLMLTAAFAGSSAIPEPIAQIGSYAMTISGTVGIASSCLLRKACTASTPCALISFDSPIQTIGIISAALAAYPRHY